MSEAKHTPVPWQLCAHLAKHDQCSCGYRGAIWSADGESIVCELGSSPEHDGKIIGHIQPQAGRPTQLADAAFIVKAVNNHDALRNALEAMIRLHNGDGPSAVPHADRIAVVEAARKACLEAS
jgi:hypothetical protein